MPGGHRKKGGDMPARIYSEVYGPELVETMGRAFDTAWADFIPKPANQGLARSLMATAIIEAVETGTRDQERIVRQAIVALTTTIRPIQKLWAKQRPAPITVGETGPTLLAKLNASNEE
jgi:hypothetical protein